VPAVLTASALTFAWPDGTAALSGLDLQVPPGRSGLVGSNGSGKSTLLRLLAGELRPTAGSVTVQGRIGYLAQDLTLRADERVDEHLGIAPVRRALAALDAGDAAPHDFDVIGDRWDVEELTVAELDRVGLPAGVLDRRLGELSGGEVTQLGLARLLLDEPDMLLLDEPTNNLDRDARSKLHDVLGSWPGTVLVVSHDRPLLERVDRIAELSDRSLRWYGGGWSAYEDAVAAEQASAEQAVRTAQAGLRREHRDVLDAGRVLAKRRQFAAKAFANKREPRAVMRVRKRTAQVSAAKYTATQEQRLAGARERLTEAEQRVRELAEIHVDLPGTAVPGQRVVLETHDLVLRNGLRVDLHVRGTERVAVVGPNGSGKSTLLHTVAGSLAPATGSVHVRVPMRLLPQRLDLLDDRLSIAENVARFAPRADANAVRSRLARFLFRGVDADRPAGRLSGGERFRATLAALLLAEPEPQLLLLDEPTNNLDLASLRQLVTALESYRGALLVASHDEGFLDDLGVTRTVELG